jgi:hypothetical protein
VSAPFDYAGCSPDDMQIMPNPASGLLTIVWCRRVSVRLSAIDGRDVGGAVNVTDISFRNLPAGMYILSVYDSSGNRVRVEKIVKLR